MEKEQIKEHPCENEDCEFFKTLARGAHCDAEDVCGGYYNTVEEVENER